MRPLWQRVITGGVRWYMLVLFGFGYLMLLFGAGAVILHAVQYESGPEYALALRQVAELAIVMVLNGGEFANGAIVVASKLAVLAMVLVVLFLEIARRCGKEGV